MKVNGTYGIDMIKAYSTQIKKAGVENKPDGQAQGDTLEISSEARKMQSYKLTLDQIPAVREDLVASIKKQVEAGTYAPDSEKIASGIIRERHV